VGWGECVWGVQLLYSEGRMGSGLVAREEADAISGGFMIREI